MKLNMVRTAVPIIIIAAIVIAFAAGFACDMQTPVFAHHAGDYLTEHYDPGGTFAAVMTIDMVIYKSYEYGINYSRNATGSNAVNTAQKNYVLPSGRGTNINDILDRYRKSRVSGARSPGNLILRC